MVAHLRTANRQRAIMECLLPRPELALLRDYHLHSVAVVPFGALVEMASAAGKILMGPGMPHSGASSTLLQHVTSMGVLLLPPKEQALLQLATDFSKGSFEAISPSPGVPEHVYARGLYRRARSEVVNEARLPSTLHESSLPRLIHQFLGQQLGLNNAVGKVMAQMDLHQDWRAALGLESCSQMASIISNDCPSTAVTLDAGLLLSQSGIYPSGCTPASMAISSRGPAGLFADFGSQTASPGPALGLLCKGVLLKECTSESAPESSPSLLYEVAWEAACPISEALAAPEAFPEAVPVVQGIILARSPKPSRWRRRPQLSSCASACAASIQTVQTALERGCRALSLQGLVSMPGIARSAASALLQGHEAAAVQAVLKCAALESSISCSAEFTATAAAAAASQGGSVYSGHSSRGWVVSERPSLLGSQDLYGEKHDGGICLLPKLKAAAAAELPGNSSGGFRGSFQAAHLEQVLITGGFGAIGSRIAAWLLASGALRVRLVGRTARSLPAAVFQQALGAECLVEGLQADVSSWEDSSLAHGSQEAGIRCVMHAGGALHDATLTRQTLKGIRTVFSGKVDSLGRSIQETWSQPIQQQVNKISCHQSQFIAAFRSKPCPDFVQIVQAQIVRVCVIYILRIFDWMHSVNRY